MGASGGGGLMAKLFGGAKALAGSDTAKTAGKLAVANARPATPAAPAEVNPNLGRGPGVAPGDQIAAILQSLFGGGI